MYIFYLTTIDMIYVQMSQLKLLSDKKKKKSL